VTLVFTAIADLLSPSEYFSININGVSVGNVFAQQAHDCPTTPDTAQLVLPAATFNNAVEGEDAEINIVASSDVNPQLCGGTSYVTVSLQYQSHGGDCNTNNILDVCEPDNDGDGILINCDNCVDVPNANQLDSDGDGVGNACDICPNVFNPSQSDEDQDGVGDACDNCLSLANTDQADGDQDGVGNVCDLCPQSQAGTAVSSTGCPIVAADFDRDGDVDLSDFGHLQICLTGNSIPQNLSSCTNARLDGDTDVDTFDINVFLLCMRGANIPVDQNCAN
jgi:hypothetical protein